MKSIAVINSRQKQTASDGCLDDAKEWKPTARKELAVQEGCMDTDPVEGAGGFAKSLK